jgi:hypothetical protein
VTKRVGSQRKREGHDFQSCHESRKIRTASAAEGAPFAERVAEKLIDGRPKRVSGAEALVDLRRLNGTSELVPLPFVTSYFPQAATSRSMRIVRAVQN